MTEHPGAKNWFEWLVFAVGAVLTFGTVGILVYEIATTGERHPPIIEVELGPAENRNGHFAVPITVTNDGDRTAEGVIVEVSLTTSDRQQKELAAVEFQFVPGQGSRHGWVTFESDPANGTLHSRTLGFEQP